MVFIPQELGILKISKSLADIAKSAKPQVMRLQHSTACINYKQIDKCIFDIAINAHNKSYQCFILGYLELLYNVYVETSTEA